ncbi:MAG: hypothetical protein LUC24_00055 [Bacteroidales bacterium]|nr:hypothetical protein [Bacteroidales bacterium]
MQDLSDNWIAVVNLHAGAGKTAHLWDRAKSLLVSRGINFECRETRRERHATDIVFNAAQQGYKRFIAVGGDGTVHETLGGIMSYVEAVGEDLSDFTLAVIPIGSGNDWIKTHNIPLDVEVAVGLIAADSFSMQDVVKATVLSENDTAFAASAGSGAGSGFGMVGEDSDKSGVGSTGVSEKVGYDMAGVTGTAVDSRYARSEVSYMVNIGGIGYDSRICDTVNRWKEAGRHGSLLYLKSLFYNFFHYKFMNVDIECDGQKTYSGETFSIAFGNGKYSGNGLLQTPEAVFNDGLLEVTIIPRYSKLRILRELPKFFAGKILTINGVIAKKVRSVIVRPIAADRETCEIDGEIIGPVPVLLTVCPGQLRVLHQF